MQSATLLAAALKRVIERYTILREESNQITLSAWLDLYQRVAEQNEAASYEDLVNVTTIINILGMESDEEDEDEQNAQVPMQSEFSSNASKELRSRTVYYQLC
jgi:hypothetical protein